MLTRLRHRCLRPTWFWAGLLALSLVWQPMLAILGDLHATRHPDLLTHLAHEHTGAPTPEAPDGGDFLHGLMHAALCCGQLPALPVSHGLALPRVHASERLLAVDVLFESLAPPRLLRPPISA